MEPTKNVDTLAVHAGESRVDGAATTPIFQSSTFAYRGGEDYHDIRYIRLNNTPNHDAVQQKLAALEGGEAALVLASGMAAIASTFLTVLPAPSHVLVQRGPYGGTHGLLGQLAAHGVTHDFIDGDRPATWDALRRPETRAIYVEAMTNPLLEIPDFAAVTAFAHRHRLVSLIDATFASPVNFRPLALGFDLVLHSCTKYLNGHSDLVAGAVVGSAALVTRIKHTADYHGGSLDPHACWLLQRGMKTLPVRVRRQNETALALARYLEPHSAVLRVHYPGLPSHPQHVRARELFRGGGGVVSFDLKGGAPAAHAAIAKLRLPLHAPSLGGVESLVTCPGTTTHATLDPRERAQLGLGDGLIRYAVGLEDADDLIADLDQALA